MSTTAISKPVFQAFKRSERSLPRAEVKTPSKCLSNTGLYDLITKCWPKLFYSNLQQKKQFDLCHFDLILKTPVELCHFELICKRQSNFFVSNLFAIVMMVNCVIYNLHRASVLQVMLFAYNFTFARCKKTDCFFLQR